MNTYTIRHSGARVCTRRSPLVGSPVASSRFVAPYFLILKPDR